MNSHSSFAVSLQPVPRGVSGAGIPMENMGRRAHGSPAFVEETEGMDTDWCSVKSREFHPHLK